MTAEDRKDLFDEWAAEYERFVLSAKGFPFEGYDAVLEEVVRQSDSSAGITVLDLGIGTGTLSRRFVALGCSVCGIDFSKEMLARARASLPGVTLVQADLLGEWAGLLGRRFDRIVSSYVLHEFDLETKVDLVARLSRDHLGVGGRIVIGDIAFPTLDALERAHQRNRESWDDSEHYWAADETIGRFQAKQISVSFTEVSACGGVFVFTPASVTNESASGGRAARPDGSAAPMS